MSHRSSGFLRGGDVEDGTPSLAFATQALSYIPRTWSYEPHCFQGSTSYIFNHCYSIPIYFVTENETLVFFSFSLPFPHPTDHCLIDSNFYLSNLQSPSIPTSFFTWIIAINVIHPFSLLPPTLTTHSLNCFQEKIFIKIKFWHVIFLL